MNSFFSRSSSSNLHNSSSEIHIRGQQSTFPEPLRALLLGLWEYIPEAKSLVSGSGDDALAVRGHREVKNTIGVAGKRGLLLHGWELPDNDLVEVVPMRADYLIRGLREQEVTDL